MWRLPQEAAEGLLHVAAEVGDFPALAVILFVREKLKGGISMWTVETLVLVGVTFFVAGREVKATIASTRKINWDSFQPRSRKPWGTYVINSSPLKNR